MQPTHADLGVAQPTEGNLPTFQPQKPTNMEELMKQTWNATDLVQVTNLDNEAFEWDAANDKNDTVVQPDKVTYEVYRGRPEHYRLESGQSNIYFGSVAYIFVNGMYRKLLQKENKAASMSDPDTQKLYLDKIFQGIKDPLTMMREKIKNEQTATQDVASDLGLNDDTTENTNRKRRPQTSHS